jgi:NAD(P)H-flavin reductase
VTVDVGEADWTGKVGVVTKTLSKEDVDIPNAIAFSCGPEIMLKFVTQTLLKLGFQPSQIYLSMNRRMSCGMGKCGRCNIGPYYLCKDGPDICYEKIKGYANVF